MSLPFTHLFWKKVTDWAYYMDVREYAVLLEDGASVRIPVDDIDLWETIPEAAEEKLQEQRYQELEHKYNELKAQQEQTTLKITKAFEEKLKDEQRLRAEAEKLAEHLRHEVLEQRRKLQRRDE